MDTNGRDDTSLAGGIEALPFVVLGIPVCAAVVVTCLMITVESLLASDPVTRRSELWQVWTVGGFAAIALVVAYGAWRRTHDRRRSAGELMPWLARGVPFLFVVGGLGGALFGFKMITDLRRDQALEDAHLCASVLGAGTTRAEPAPTALAACRPAAARCRREQAILEVRADTKRLIPDFDYRPDVICLRKAGREGGWLPPPPPPEPPFQFKLNLPH